MYMLKSLKEIEKFSVNIACFEHAWAVHELYTELETQMNMLYFCGVKTKMSFF